MGGGDTPQQGRRSNNYFDGLVVTGMHKAIFFIIMVAYFFEQMDNWNFGLVSNEIFTSWGIPVAERPAIMSTIVFWYFMGMTLGGFLGGIIADFIGRKKTFLYAIMLFSVCSIINGLPIHNLTLFVVARSLTGFGVFCLMVCSQAYIAEMAPAESRGKWQGLVAAVGFCVVPVVALVCALVVPLSKEAWRIIFYFGGTGILAFFVALKYLKESPRWLVSKGRTKEAEKVIMEITGQDIDLSEAAKNVPPKVKFMEVLTGMFAPKYIKRTLVIMFLFICVTPATFTFTTWSAQLLSKTYTPFTKLIIMTFILCGVPAGCYLASRISDKGGRKIPLAATYALAGVTSLVFAYVYTNPILVTVTGFLLSAFYMAGGFITASYTAESYPTQMRSTAAGTHNGLARFAVSGFQKVVPFIMAAMGGIMGSEITAVFTTTAVMFALPVPILLLFGMRTGGKSLEEIS